MLSTVLAACSTTKTVVQTEYITPPATYTIACERTKFTGSTYGDAIVYLRTVMKERDVCANRIDKIREWQVKYAMN